MRITFQQGDGVRGSIAIEINRNALHYIRSILIIFCCLNGSQTGLAYSIVCNNSDIYAVNLSS